MLSYIYYILQYHKYYIFIYHISLLLLYGAMEVHRIQAIGVSILIIDSNMVINSFYTIQSGKPQNKSFQQSYTVRFFYI